jgi:hypothetical protein
VGSCKNRHLIDETLFSLLEEVGPEKVVGDDDPAFLGAKLTCLEDSYTGINGRRKKLRMYSKYPKISEPRVFCYLISITKRRKERS